MAHFSIQIERNPKQDENKQEDHPYIDPRSRF